MMHAKLCKDQVNVVSDSTGEIWDTRLGHMSKRGMHIVADQKLLPKVVHANMCCVDAPSHHGG